MAHHFSHLPANIPGKPTPFSFRVSDQDLSDFNELIRISRIGPTTWWNQQNNGQFGVTREWLIQAKSTWLGTFDWRKHEEHINTFPNYKIDVEDPEVGGFNIHFAALFSLRKDAVPIIFMHGWPGSFLEFLPMMELLVKKYTPDTLPYHIIVPSLPDYGLSSGPTQNVEVTLEQAARAMNQLMIDLGFGHGYVAQGGDVGFMLARLMSTRFSECRAFHVNILSLNLEDEVDTTEKLSIEERQQLERAEVWQKTGSAYAFEHGTRPATIGLALSSSPLAMLPWIGEKFLEWVDDREPLPLDTILYMVSFYWFTSTYPRSLYPYRALVGSDRLSAALPISKNKPLGYSAFPREQAILPKAWAEQVYPNLVFYKAHSKGGHFAALEQPTTFLKDIEDFIQLLA
ncbi:putative epoxide hydrolase [Daldinia childiae]|uniref:putative epoxide hydrolase n=1 Tax=Daldinia childiae TaxID=326645 RepID=UPI001447BC89|nr:putative epoxide hydrolase [Daldinia childiae]KAF3069709.1 putative epoxide hydrolase [Daldinia childiae]